MPCLNTLLTLKKYLVLVLPVRLSLLGIIPWSEKSPVGFPVSTYAWVAGLFPGLGQLIDVSVLHQSFFPSISPFLPFSLKIKKENILKKYLLLNEKVKLKINENPLKCFNQGNDLTRLIFKWSRGEKEWKVDCLEAYCYSKQEVI